MIPYLINLLKEFSEELGAPYDTPSPYNIFKVRPEGKARLLPEEQSQVFHHTVAQMLLLSARSLREIQTAVAFLTTRVKQPGEDNWFKLRRCIK